MTSCQQRKGQGSLSQDTRPRNTCRTALTSTHLASWELWRRTLWKCRRKKKELVVASGHLADFYFLSDSKQPQKLKDWFNSSRCLSAQTCLVSSVSVRRLLYLQTCNGSLPQTNSFVSNVTKLFLHFLYQFMQNYGTELKRFDRIYNLNLKVF